MSKSRTKVNRAPKRGIYDKAEINAILDRHFLCHVSLIYDDQPLVIPTMFGRDGDAIYIHGATVSRLIKSTASGIPVCVSVASVQELVLARSAFHHSLNYESVVFWGMGTLVEDDEKERALKAISDHLIPGRWEEVRQPNAKELKATSVVRISIDEATAKVRTGPPIDDKADYELPIWAGTVPINSSYGDAQNDPVLLSGIDTAASVQQLIIE